MVSVTNEYQVGAAAVARTQEAERWSVEPSTLPAGRGGTTAAVTFAQVRFRNRPELPEVHHSASVAIPHRGTTAFIGLSGAGKTGCPR